MPDPAARIEKLLALWREDVPGDWRRGDDPALTDGSRRYRRSHKGEPNPEHALELEVLGQQGALEPMRCLGAPVVDGINAVSLVRDAAGGRAANVEADMLLLVDRADGSRQFLVEAKVNSDNAWYAAVELLLQLRLFLESPAAQRILRKRGAVRDLPESLPVTGLVVAPPPFYSATGKKENSVESARQLLGRLRELDLADARLAVWKATDRTIDELR